MCVVDPAPYIMRCAWHDTRNGTSHLPKLWFVLLVAVEAVGGGKDPFGRNDASGAFVEIIRSIPVEL